MMSMKPLEKSPIKMLTAMVSLVSRFHHPHLAAVFLEDCGTGEALLFFQEGLPHLPALLLGLNRLNR